MGTVASSDNLGASIFVANPLAATFQTIPGVSSILQVEIDLTSNPGENIYVPFYNHASPTVGTTQPRMLLKGIAGARRTYTFPKAVAGVFATGCTVAAVREKGGAGTTAPSGTAKVTVRFV